MANKHHESSQWRWAHSPRDLRLLTLCSSVLLSGLWGCSERDPIVSILRIFDPLGDVIIRLEAAETGAAPSIVRVEWEGVPNVDTPDFDYVIWLLPYPDGEPFRLAQFALPRDRTFQLEVEGVDLINLAAAVEVTLESEDPSSASPTPSEEFLTHLAPVRPATLQQIRVLLGSDASSETGLTVRLAAQAQALQHRAELASDSADAGNAVEARRSLEHVLNITQVPPQDHDGNGVVENPDADDLGLRVLSERVAEAARAAAAQADAWASATEHGPLAALAADSMGARLERLIVLSQTALAAQDLADLQSMARATSALSDTVVGDADSDVAGPCSRCGALTASQQSLLMTARRATPQETFVIARARVPKEATVHTRLAFLGLDRN